MTWDGQDLAKGSRFESPDDGNPDDRTVLSVPLPRPVAPGETITLEIAWKAKAPEGLRPRRLRPGLLHGRPVVPEDRRLRAEGAGGAAPSAGWNCHQYHANSEFYADWGDYRVAITVPERFVVGSAGALVAETRGERERRRSSSSRSRSTTSPGRPIRATSSRRTLFDPAKDVPKDEIARAAKILGRSEAELLGRLPAR